MNMSIFAQYYYPMIHSQYWEASMIIMMFLGLLFAALIAVILIHALKHRGAHNTHRNDPLDIAKERYAKGDISKEQFEQIKTDLSDH